MKQLLLIILVFLISCGSNKNTKENIDDEVEIIGVKHKYKIVKIDSTKNLYIFYAKKNDSIFKLLSEKTEQKKCSSKIIENEYYNLIVKSIFSPKLIQKTEISNFEFDGDIIKLGTDGSVWDLFYSENIKGLCYEK